MRGRKKELPVDDDWVETTEDLPQVGMDVDQESVRVKCMTDTGIICNGYYDYSDNTWHQLNKNKKMNVARWQSL